MNKRNYKYVTCKKDEYDSLVAANDEYSNHVIHLDRDANVTNKSNPPTSLKGTNSHYQFRMPSEFLTASTETKPPIYEVHMTKRVCACTECRRGRFDSCRYRGAIGAPTIRNTHGRKQYTYPVPAQQE